MTTKIHLAPDGRCRPLAFVLTAGQAGDAPVFGSVGVTWAAGPPAFDGETHKQRRTVERCVNRLKQWRGIATRYEKTATIYLAGLHIAGIFLWSAR